MTEIVYPSWVMCEKPNACTDCGSDDGYYIIQKCFPERRNKVVNIDLCYECAVKYIPSIVDHKDD